MVFEKIKSNFTVSNNFAAVCQEKYCKSHHNQILQTMKKNMRFSKQQSFCESFHSYENINGYHKRKIVWFVHYWEKKCSTKKTGFYAKCAQLLLFKESPFFVKQVCQKTFCCSKKMCRKIACRYAIARINHSYKSFVIFHKKTDSSNMIVATVIKRIG